MCVCTVLCCRCPYNYVNDCGYNGGQKRASDILKLELQVVVSQLIWMLGTELRWCTIFPATAYLIRNPLVCSLWKCIWNIWVSQFINKKGYLSQNSDFQTKDRESLASDFRNRYLLFMLGVCVWLGKNHHITSLAAGIVLFIRGWMQKLTQTKRKK